MFDLTEIKELEFEFENEIKALEKIIFSNLSSVFFDVVLIKYDKHNTKKINICKWNAKKNLRDFMRMFYKQNIFYKNLAKRENIYLAVTSQTKFLNFIWLDDIKLENINEKQLKYMTFIETSPGNYQAWIKLDKLYTKSEIQQIKNYLIKTLKADKAASSYIQPMRLPGVYSFKHQEPFYVKTYKIGTKTLNGRELLNKINNLNIKTETKQEDFKNKINISQNKNKNKNDAWKKYSYYKKQLDFINIEFSPEDERDTIKNFYIKKQQEENKKLKEKKEPDENIVDIYYIYQLLIRNYSREEIFEYLYKNRKDLDDKHIASDYFERTYLKALLFKKLFYPRLKLYEHRLLDEYIDERKKNGEWDESKKVIENLQILINNFKK